MRSNLKLLKKAEDEYEELNGNRTGDSGHVNAIDIMVSAFQTSTEIRHGMCRTVSRQHQYSAENKEW